MLSELERLWHVLRAIWDAITDPFDVLPEDFSGMTLI